MLCGTHWFLYFSSKKDWIPRNCWNHFAQRFLLESVSDKAIRRQQIFGHWENIFFVNLMSSILIFRDLNNLMVVKHRSSIWFMSWSEWNCQKVYRCKWHSFWHLCIWNLHLNLRYSSNWHLSRTLIVKKITIWSSYPANWCLHCEKSIP